ncbi:hippocampus abundant transcript 1 protein-like isoform X2 [Phalaenopsis equestris]|uniref:hippocampus abundant transcript 1 protein-like isoform X2 n=1 Tax=Phalaenopsis equestris TaxID=78828 RepID=UPI0009E28037|nr:hippocampus abundant transcript 1 protein-like isoform X2 [Phalaenopsis equestris]
MEDLKGLGHLFACAFLYTFATCTVIPSITDVTMEALCPGEDRCSLAIYLTGFTQAITGLGTFLVTPVIGNLSDKYGRKTMLTLPMTVGIIPLVILAFGRTRPFFYVYYFIKMFTGMFSEGTMQCLTHAYVADKTCEGRRISAFGVLSGISAAGFVSATLAARFIPSFLTFQVAAAVAISAMLYMRFFLAETDGGASLADESCRLLCSSSPPSDADSPAKLPILGKASSLLDMLSLFRSSFILSRAAVVAFIDSLGSSGFQASIMYFLKAQFKFSKDQYADLMLISGVAGAISQLFLMPVLAPAIGEEILLSVGLLASCANVLLTSIAWSSWVLTINSIFISTFKSSIFFFILCGFECVPSPLSKNHRVKKGRA